MTIPEKGAAAESACGKARLKFTPERRDSNAGGMPPAR